MVLICRKSTVILKDEQVLRQVLYYHALRKCTQPHLLVGWQMTPKPPKDRTVRMMGIACQRFVSNPEGIPRLFGYLATNAQYPAPFWSETRFLGIGYLKPNT